MTQKIREVENAFLSVLREDNDRNYLNKKIQYFEAGDWDKLYELAAKSGLFCVFYTKLLSLKLEDVPVEFLSKLKNAYFLNLKRNTLLERELFRILTYFKELNIPVIPLKGPILARYLYNDSGLRQASCDLDLLVRYETISNAREKLAELGYCLSGIEYKRDFLCPIGLSRQVEQIMLNKSIDETLSISLDLHWCIRGFFLDTSIQKLWQEAGYFNLDSQKILMLSNEDALLYLSVISISTLEFVQLKYIYDIHRLATVFGKELNWERLLYKARHSNLENCLYFPLKLSKILFSTDISDAFLDEIRPGWIIRKLISLWINQKNILEFRQKVQFSNLARYLLGRYLYSNSPNDFLKKSFGRMLKGGQDAKLSCIKEEPQYS
ncbi:MAG: nucleotidyltransferase family protein [Candidatus Omnitrophota bacterium]|nr:nucleotidyltransferase family protein [Candidatus Omnitrophota bacterium]